MYRVLFVVFGLLVVAGCSRTPDEVRIRNAITQMAEAIDARRPSDLMAFIASDFTGNDGRFDRDELARFVRLLVMGNPSLRITIASIDIELIGDRATVSLTITTSGASGRWLPGGGERTSIVSGWRLENGDWRCYNANWSGETVDREARG